MTPEEQAQSHYARGEYQLAADLFGQALQDSPNSAALLRDHGLALALAGRPEDALTSAGKAAQLQPANPDIRYAHGYVLALAGRHAEAIEELDRALILKTTHTAAREALLGALTAQAHAVADTDPGTAEAALHRAMKLDSRNPKRAADYLEFLARTNQKGKLQREAEQIDASIQHLEPLKSTLEKLLGAHAVAPLSSSNRFVPTAQPGPTQPGPTQPGPAQSASPSSPLGMGADPLARTIMSPSSAAPGPIGHSPAAPGQTVPGQTGPVSAGGLQPCGSCGQLIMPHAVACPYCGYRAPGKSSWDQYDKPEWQETALNICLIIYILIGATDLLLTFTNQNGTVYGGVWSMARTIVATGVLFRQEWAGAVFTYMLWMSLCCGGWMAGLGTMVGAWPFIVTGVLNMAISGFMIYLVQYALGD